MLARLTASAAVPLSRRMQGRQRVQVARMIDTRPDARGRLPEKTVDVQKKRRAAAGGGQGDVGGDRVAVDRDLGHRAGHCELLLVAPSAGYLLILARERGGEPSREEYAVVDAELLGGDERV